MTSPTNVPPLQLSPRGLEQLASARLVLAALHRLERLGVDATATDDQDDQVLHALGVILRGGVCPLCGDSGEVTVCANDGSHGCSHTYDRAYPCPVPVCT